MEQKDGTCVYKAIQQKLFYSEVWDTYLVQRQELSLTHSQPEQNKLTVKTSKFSTTDVRS